MTSPQFVTDINKIDRESWNDLVAQHPSGNIFQTPEMREVYCRTRNVYPFVVACIDLDGHVHGILLAFVHHQYGGLLRTLTSRSVVAGGPLVLKDDPAMTAGLLASYNNEIDAEVIFTQIRNLSDRSSLDRVFANQGYKYDAHLNFHLDLRQTENQLWSNLHGKRRNHIRKAMNEGVSVRLLESEDEIEQSYVILKGVYQRARVPLIHKSLFLGAFDVLRPKGYIYFFGGFYGQKLVAARYVLAFGKKLYAWYEGSYLEWRSKCPNDLVTWEALRWGRDNGFEFFDFGGAGTPSAPYGVRDFKKGFGGLMVEFGRYEKVHKTVTYELSKAGFRLWQNLQRTL